jgi:uncharacterized sulfatase
MDALAESGARLTNAYVTTPVCSPSRATLMTGQYASELGIHDWLQEGEPGLDPRYVTWPELLQKAGYRTGLIGKWHLGEAERFRPANQGFDAFMGFLGGGAAPQDPKLIKDGQKQAFEGLTTDILTDHALAFMRRNRDRPFMLTVSYRAPHSPYLPVSEGDKAPYKTRDITPPSYPGLQREKVIRRTRRYYMAVTAVDRNLGRLLAALRRWNLKNETVVIFTSDHGYNTGHHGLWYKGNAFWFTKESPAATQHVPARRRPNMFDTSLRVPCLVRWPGVVEPGTVIEQTVDNTDWYPTLLDIAGLTKPEQVTLRGRSVLPLLKGQAPRQWNSALYGEYSMRHGAKTHMRMYRTPQWKLVRDYQDRSRDELYHLAEDPRERVNLLDNELSSKARKAMRRLNRKLETKMRRIDEPLLKKLP